MSSAVGIPTKICSCKGSRRCMTGSKTTDLKVSDALRISMHGDGAVILDIRSGDVFSANAVGARVVGFLREERSIEEMTDRISSEFGAQSEQVRSDIEHFIESLRARDLLQG